MRRHLHAGILEAAAAVATVAAYPLGLAGEAVETLVETTCGRPAPSGVAPVVLVHGYGGNKSCFLPLHHALRRRDIPVETFTYNPFAADIPRAAARLVHAVAHARAIHGAATVHLVGHSCGGVVVRYACHVLGLGDVVDSAVTVGAPHRGTPLAKLGPSRAAAQMQPGSRLLARIDAAARPGRTRWIACYSDTDVIVPGHAARLDGDGARNVGVPGGHLSMLWSPKVVATVVDACTARYDGSSGSRSDSSPAATGARSVTSRS